MIQAEFHCSRHPNYKAVRPPGRCAECWRVYYVVNDIRKMLRYALRWPKGGIRGN